MEEIINKVSQSKLISIDLDEYYPKIEDLGHIDIADGLFEGLILKEKDFRAWVKNLAEKANKPFYAIFCSADAIVPNWAFMLLSSALQSKNISCYYCHPEALAGKIILEKLSADLSRFEAGKIVLKGCSKNTLSPEVYLEASKLLQPVVNSLMFGEPCSTVPIYKQK